jgi:subtilisin family serine protease
LKLRLAAVALVGILMLDVQPARGTDPRPIAEIARGSPIGLSYLRKFAPQAKSALVSIPAGRHAEELGLESVAPGIGRVRNDVMGFAELHPDLRLEIPMPIHPLVDQAGLRVLSTTARATRGADGHGVMIGIADTGLDVTHPDMRDENRRSRVAWMLDLSREPRGLHPELEAQFGGLVLSKADIDELLTGDCESCLPTDEIGHGTHVTGIAAGTGAKSPKYEGIAPKADIAFVRVATDHGINNDDLVKAVSFMFDRATAEQRPIVANVSLGSDFGPHDGTTLWEQALAAQVGPDHPGRVLVAAAGNSGAALIHQSVHVTPGARVRVPIRASANGRISAVQVWVTMHRRAEIAIGLEGPDGEWIHPLARGHQAGKNTSDYNAAVIYGSQFNESPIPEASDSAVAVWEKGWPDGRYAITLEGTGVAELYLEGLLGAQVEFPNAVRQGTINLPATHPAIIGVGCTVSRTEWESISGAVVAPDLGLVDGNICPFSSAGPTVTGAPKPEIAAPGAAIISALSRDAEPGSEVSTFTSSQCPSDDRRCLQVDETHAVAMGTSMSSPVVAGVVALLLQADPTLTQDKVLALLQAGAHRFRGEAPFADQAGPGEVDAIGSLDALEQMRDPALHLPAASQSWMALSSEFVAADGSIPMTAIVELRTEDGGHRADFFAASRLKPVLLVSGRPVSPPPQMIRRGPGVWFFVWNPPPGLGGGNATFGATFDGVPIVNPKTVPIATDPWTATSPSRVSGASCSVSSAPRAGSAWALLVALGLVSAGVRRTCSSHCTRGARCTPRPSCRRRERC